MLRIRWITPGLPRPVTRDQPSSRSWLRLGPYVEAQRREDLGGSFAIRTRIDPPGSLRLAPLSEGPRRTNDGEAVLTLAQPITLTRGPCSHLRLTARTGLLLLAILVAGCPTDAYAEHPSD